MPSSCSKVVRKLQLQSEATQDTPQRRGVVVQRRRRSASPLISDGTTSEAALCEWAVWFGRFHTDPSELYIPIALRTVDCVVTVQRQPQAQPKPPHPMRCVREVAKFNGAQGVEWMLITWVPGLPGAQFNRCASHDAAMSLLDAPPTPVSF